MSNKVKVTINSVRAINKLTNEMAIDFNIGKMNKIIIADCANISIYQAIENYIHSIGRLFGRDYVKTYEGYNGEDLKPTSEDIDAISRELARLDNYGLEPYSEPLRQYILQITT